MFKNKVQFSLYAFFKVDPLVDPFLVIWHTDCFMLLFTRYVLLEVLITVILQYYQSISV